MSSTDGKDSTKDSTLISGITAAILGVTDTQIRVSTESAGGRVRAVTREVDTAATKEKITRRENGVDTTQATAAMVMVIGAVAGYTVVDTVETGFHVGINGYLPNLPTPKTYRVISVTISPTVIEVDQDKPVYIREEFGGDIWGGLQRKELVLVSNTHPSRG